jgi:hypothetical protein
MKRKSVSLVKTIRSMTDDIRSMGDRVQANTERMTGLFTDIEDLARRGVNAEISRHRGYATMNARKTASDKEIRSYAELLHELHPAWSRVVLVNETVKYFGHDVELRRHWKKHKVKNALNGWKPS